MDPATIIIIVTLTTLVIERLFKWTIKIKKSSCCNGATVIEMQNEI